MAGVVIMVVWSLFIAFGVPFLISASRAEEDAGLQEFVDELEDGELSERGWFTPAHLAGKLEGRRVKLTVGDHNGMLRYHVQVRHGLGRVILDRDDLRQRLERIPPRSAQALEARGALQHLIGRLGIYSFTLTDDGWLEVARSGSSYAMKPASLRQVFGQLVKLAPLFESRSVQIQVLGEASARAWTGGGDEILCPFCRDTVGQEELEVMACPSCRTVHHSECFTEAGGCTVFGCSGAPQTRVSA